MNEWLKKMAAKFKDMWGKWKPVQKIILAGIAVVVLAAVFLMFRVSSSPSGVRLYETKITDEAALSAIINWLESENIRYTKSEDGYIILENRTVQRRVKTALDIEGYTPNTVSSPFDKYRESSWSETDEDKNRKYAEFLKEELEKNLKFYDDIANATVTITSPKKAIFSSEQEPVSCSVTLRLVPGSELRNDKKRLKGLQNYICNAVVGLKAENLTIMDTESNTLNDFESLAESDRLDNVKKELKIVSEDEKELRRKVLSALQNYFNGTDKVRDLNIKIEKNFDKVSREQKIITPIQIKSQDPDKPYDTTETRDYIPLSSQTVTKEWTGTGYNPQGPAGVEGQNPPVYSDMSNVIGKSVETGVTQNNVFNEEQRKTEQNSQLVRITASCNIDGKWETQTDSKRSPIVVTEENIDSLKEYCRSENISKENYRISLGKFFRIYTPVPQETIEAVKTLVQDAIGFDRKRGDSVTITNIAVPRDAEWALEEDNYFKKQQTRTTILLVLAGTAVVLVVFIIFRFISRELERRKRLREEEILRRQQAEREKALWDAKRDGVDVTMTVEERKRAELQENAIAMAKEHPEDVAMLVRTWLMEE